MKIIEGGITSPKGFKATGNHIGIKKKKKDLAIIFSEVPAKAAAVFTKNIVKAAPVLWDQEIINKKALVQGIVINSGNANACTGEVGLKHTEIMAETLANCLDIQKDQVLVCSTGIIGLYLPIDLVCEGIKQSYSKIDNSYESAKNAAEAILTTDTFSKEIAVEFEIDDKVIKIAGIAKGSGMIEPNMATMLGFITTDANISQELLQKALSESVEDSYNMISVDGDTSTNDTVILLANGLAGNPEITQKNDDYKKFKEALDYVNTYLAKQVIYDGEGATKFLEVQIKDARSKEDARKIAKSIINSCLVKTAFFGEDANWGRIIAAMGYSGGYFDPSKVKIDFASKAGTITLLENGAPISFNEEKAASILKEKDITVLVKLQDGQEEAVAWGCDLSYQYVKINGDYRT